METGFTIWFTGKPLAGKTILANNTAETLETRGFKVEVITCKALREELWRDTGWSKEDTLFRAKNIAYICRTLNKYGIVAVVAAVSAYQEARDEARNELKNFIEIFLHAPVEILKKRDTNKIYQTPIYSQSADRYENPDNPELTLNTGSESIDNCLKSIITKLEEMGYVEPVDEDYTDEEKEEIDERLKSLGYM